MFFRMNWKGKALRAAYLLIFQKFTNFTLAPFQGQTIRFLPIITIEAQAKVKILYLSPAKENQTQR
jgi:hypothetical protein